MMSRFALPFAIVVATLASSNAVANEFRLIPHDPVPVPFAAGPVPRLPAIADDAALNDITTVGKHAWAVGERGVIVRSVDGGMTWSTQVLPVECSLQSVNFLTAQIGQIAGFTIDAASGETRGLLLKTRDSGDTWRSVDLTVDSGRMPGIKTVRFFDLERGYVLTMADANQPAALRATTDGGRSWSSLPTDSSAEWLDAEFTGPAEGMLVGARMAWGTIVGNQIVTLSPPQPITRHVRAASMTSDGRAWIVGDGGLVMQSTSRGVTWAAPTGPLPEHFRDVFDLQAVVHHEQRMCAAGTPGTSVVSSDDGGQTWSLHPTGLSGGIRRIRHAGDDVLLALSSWGTILRSADFGKTWAIARGQSRRAALMCFVTDPTDGSVAMLATEAGDSGFRSVIAQPSTSQLRNPDDPAHVTSALNQMGVGHFAADWRFSRRRTQQELSQSSLLQSWDAQSDGRLKNLFPLRLATFIRTWQPDVVCIEAQHERDAVAGIVSSAVFTASNIAAGADPRTSVLDTLGLPRWSTARIVRRQPGQRTTLSYAADDLLPSLQTTAGLIHEHIRLQYNARETRPAADGAYVIHNRKPVPTPARMFQGIDIAPGTAARRALPPRADNAGELRAVLSKHQMLQAAVTGQVARDPLSDALIAELSTLGDDLPPSLAAQQILHVSELFRSRENIEGLIATLKEITRRSPQSAHGARAAEELHLLYSSQEISALRAMPVDENGRKIESSDAPPALPPGTFIGQPEIRPVSGASLSAIRPAVGSDRQGRDLRWNEQAEIAWKLLQSSAPERITLARNLLLRAARVRRTGEMGADRSILADAAQANDPHAVLARAEMQATFSATETPIPVHILPKSIERPNLDAVFSDECWQQAHEIRLRDSQHPEAFLDSLIMMTWDDEFLFLAGRIPSVPESPPADEILDRIHDEADVAGDHVEIMFDIDRDYSTGFHLTIDSAGRTSDRCGPWQRWDPQWYVATDRDVSGWRFEAAIPVDQLLLEIPLKPGLLWATTISRVVPGYTDQRVVADDVTPPPESRYSLLRFIRSGP